MTTPQPVTADRSSDRAGTVPHETRRLEIRCCCDPARLYGSLEVEGPITPHEVVVRAMRACSPYAAEPVEFLRFEIDLVTVPVEESLEEVRQRIGKGERIPPKRTYPALKYLGDDDGFAVKAARLFGVIGFEPSAEALAVVPRLEWP